MDTSISVRLNAILEYLELKKPPMSNDLRLKHLSAPKRLKSSHQVREIHPITGRGLRNSVLFIDRTGAAAAEVKLRENITDARIDGNRISDPHRWFEDRASRLSTYHRP